MARAARSVAKPEATQHVADRVMMSHMVDQMGQIQRNAIVGIGGVGMSGIAEVLLNQGYQVFWIRSSRRACD